MFTGVKSTTTAPSYLKTGLSAFKILGVNPSALQIEEWTGRTDVQEPNYDLQNDYNNEHMVRPLHIYLRNEDGVIVNFRMAVSNDPDIKQSGNYKVCTSTGAIVWAKASGSSEVKPEFADHKPLKIGEADWIEFISKLINFDTRSGENLYQQLADKKLSADDLYNGNYSGVKDLVKWADDADKKISMVLTVREKEVETDSNTTVKRYQSVASDPQTWFHGEPSDWAENKLLSRYEKSLEITPGQTKAYPIIKDLFTTKYQNFVKEDCVNYVPENPNVVSQGWN